MNDAHSASMKRTVYEVVGYLSDLPDILTGATSANAIDCKFVLIANAQRVWLVYGPLSDYPYHADLVSRFCREQSIGTHWKRRPDQLHIVDRQYGLHGGGFLTISPVARTVTCTGLSKSYGPFSAPILGQLLVSQQHFAPFTCRLA